MPKGTKVHRCVQKVKRKGGLDEGAAIATCQKATKQSYKTGKSLRGRGKRGR